MSLVQVKQSTPAGAPWPVGVIVYAKEQGSLKLPSSACLADDLYPLTEQGDNHDTDKFLHEWVHCSESGWVNTLTSDLYASIHTALEPW